MEESEDPFRVMVDTMPAWAWTSLPDGSTEFLNHSWLDYTGLPMTEGLGWAWQARIHPDDLPRLLLTWQHLLAAGRPGEEQARLRRSDGAYRWFLFRAVPRRNARGEIVRWYGTNTDIEDLKRAEALLSAEKRTLDLIGSGAELGAILETLCTFVEAEWPGVTAAVFLAAPGEQRLELAAGRRMTAAWTEFITATLRRAPGWAGFLEVRAITTDVATDPAWADHRDVALGHAVRAAWSQPLISTDGASLGALCLYHDQARVPASSDLQLLERAAHLALIATERERARVSLSTALEDLRASEARLKSDEAQLREIVDFIPHIIIVIDPRGVPLYANRVALDYLEVTPAELPTVGFGGRFSHPEDVERYWTIRREALARGHPFELEQRILGKHGHRWFLFRYNGVRDEHGEIARWYVTATDIHERKEAEDKTRDENKILREEIQRASMVEEIVGASAALLRTLGQVGSVAPTDSTVLILGETGTGKELIARAIHKRSRRAGQALIRVNCAAIPTALIASELFGHEKGSFTGAVQRRLGRFEVANGGTIFLDEIGDLPAEAQVALLRVLQERECERIGSSAPIRLDVRVIAATHRDLKAAVAAGTFREDLFYRLSVFPIAVPALRERRDDIPLLVEYLVARYATKLGKKIDRIEADTLALLGTYGWPGNIRELQNVIERAVILCDDGIFSVHETWLAREGRAPGAPERRSLRLDGQQERTLIEEPLTASGGRVAGPAGAATRLGIPRQTLESKIANLGIDKRRFKSP